MRDWCRPEQGRRCFDQLPATLERLLTGRTTGRRSTSRCSASASSGSCSSTSTRSAGRFLERHAEHPLLRARPRRTGSCPADRAVPVDDHRAGDDDPQRAPVAEHGLYEWHVYEPPLDRLITPLLFSFAGDGTRGTLLGHLDPDALFPHESVYARLADAGVRSTVVLPAAIAGSAPNIGLAARHGRRPVRDRGERARGRPRARCDEGAGTRTSTSTRSTR